MMSQEALSGADKSVPDPGIIIENGLNDPFVGQGRCGVFVSGTDPGFGYENRNKNKANEDSSVVDSERDAYVVLDAMGGSPRTPGYYLYGDVAAGLCAEALRDGFAEENTFEEIQSDMHRRLKEANLAENGVCFLAFRIEGKVLHFAYAGDARLTIIGKEGKVRYRTRPNHNEQNHDFVKGPVTGLDVGQLISGSVELQEGDRVLVYSDGIDENLSPEEIAELIHGKSTVEAYRAIADETERLMTSGQGKPDNRSLLLYDIETPG